MLADYSTDMGVAPNAGQVNGGSVWGEGVWDQSTWGNNATEVVTQEPVSVGGSGYAISLGYQVSSGSIAPLDAKIVRLELTFETAELLT